MKKKIQIQKNYIILSNGCLIRTDRIVEGLPNGKKQTIQSLKELFEKKYPALVADIIDGSY